MLADEDHVFFEQDRQAPDELFAWAEGVFERVRGVRGPVATAFGYAQAAANIFSLIASCVLHGLDVESDRAAASRGTAAVDGLIAPRSRT